MLLFGATNIRDLTVCYISCKSRLLSVDNVTLLLPYTHWQIYCRQINADDIVITKELHYNDVIMSKIASQVTSLTSVYSTVYSNADQRKHQSSTSLAFVQGIPRRPGNSLHKWPVTRKMFPFDDVIMNCQALTVKYECFICLLSYIATMILNSWNASSGFLFDIFVPRTNFNKSQPRLQGVPGNTGVTLSEKIIVEIRGNILFFMLTIVRSRIGKERIN